MHSRLGRIISDVFYRSQLRTAGVIAAARTHPLPTCFIEGGGREEKPRGATSFQNEGEADEVIKLVKLLIEHGGHSQDQINVLSFYNGQRFVPMGGKGVHYHSLCITCLPLIQILPQNLDLKRIFHTVPEGAG